jgi:GDP-4-dehydro-6-deoxy-D-mannose reductase
MRVLITGVSGFVGRHLIKELRQAGHTPLGFDLQACSDLADTEQAVGSITDRAALAAWVQASRADACVHLAGISFVPKGWADPQGTMEINVNGTLNVLEAFREHYPAARILVVTSAEVYGRDDRVEPVCEDHALQPSNLYGVSKMAADLGSLLYARHHGMSVMTARPQNHIGPGQSRLFVVTAFAEQLIAMRRDRTQPAVLRTGNLESRRDFTDVRDVVRAYRLLVEQGVAGEAYNIASDRMVPIRDMLAQLCAHAEVQPEIEIDPNRYRPTDRPPQLCIEKISKTVGWHPLIPLAQTLEDIYDDLAAAQAS